MTSPTPTSTDTNAPNAVESDIDTSDSSISAADQSATTPIQTVARRRARRRMVFALLLVLVGIVAWKNIPGYVPDSQQLTPNTADAQQAAPTKQEALKTITSTQASTSALNMLNAGVIAAQNYRTAMGTWDGFSFPGTTVVTGTKGAVIIVQESGTCYSRTVTTTGAASDTINDPSSCTASGQLALKRDLS